MHNDADATSENFNRGGVTCELLLWPPVPWEVISARE